MQFHSRRVADTNDAFFRGVCSSRSHHRRRRCHPYVALLLCAPRCAVLCLCVVCCAHCPVPRRIAARKRNARTERRNWKLKLESVPYRFPVRRRPHSYFFDPVNKQCSCPLFLSYFSIATTSNPYRGSASRVTKPDASHRLVLKSAAAAAASRPETANMHYVYFLANRARSSHYHRAQ